MKTRKICIVLTARGNYAKMKPIISEIKRRKDTELVVLVGGSLVLERYGKILEDDKVDQFEINHVIHFLVEGENPLTMAKSAGMAVNEFATAFENTKPDIVIVIADRFESLAIAMAASYMNIGIAHIEGGETSGSIDESIRHAITKLSHLHFVASSNAAERIIRMGEDKEYVFAVGSTSIDSLRQINLDDLSSVVADQNTQGVGSFLELKTKQFLLVAHHPVTTEYKDNYRNAAELTKAIEIMNMPTVWLWPNMDAGADGVSKAIRSFREESNPKNIRFFKSLPIESFGPLLKHTACIVGNSSSGIRESAFLGTPSVNVGTRQSGRERASNVVDVDYGKDAIVEGIRRQLKHGAYEPNPLYGSGDAATTIVNVLSEAEFDQQKRNTY